MISFYVDTLENQDTFPVDQIDWSNSTDLQRREYLGQITLSNDSSTGEIDIAGHSFQVSFTNEHYTYSFEYDVYGGGEIEIKIMILFQEEGEQIYWKPHSDSKTDFLQLVKNLPDLSS